MTGFVIELLDQEEHESLHSWQLADQAEEVTVGRSPDCTVVLGNRFVSRLHARLLRTTDGWTLHNESSQGIWLDGREVQSAPVAVGAVFRLGGMGPSLRIAAPPQEAISAESTVRLRPGDLLILHLDRDQRDREVEEIASSPFFGGLGERSAEPRVLSVHSFRGGTGKSNTTANLAAQLARRGYRVAAIDTDIQSPGIHAVFGCAPESFEVALNDYLWGRAAIEEAAVDVTSIALPDGEDPGDGRLYLVPSALDAGEIARVLKEGYDVARLGEGYRQLIEKLSLDILLVDTHPGVNEETLLSVAVSDLLLLILRPDVQDFQGSAVTLELARRLGVRNVLVALSKVPPRVDEALLTKQVEDAYEASVAAVLPLSSEVARAASGSLFSITTPDHPYSQEIDRLAGRILEEIAQ